MEFMTTKEAVEKWNISERRIRQLLQEGRIEGAVKVGSTWNIPKDAIKPTDKRVVRPDNNEFIINLDENYFEEVDKLKKELDSKRPISKETLKSLKESINLEFNISNFLKSNETLLKNLYNKIRNIDNSIFSISELKNNLDININKTLLLEQIHSILKR